MPETLDFPPLSKADAPSVENIAEDIFASYEAKIENISSFFEATQLLLIDFQDPLLSIKEERNQINGQLQDLLAKNEHLRRKDFNRMMQGILTIQVEKEKEIRNLVNSFLTEHREMTILLRDNFIKIKESLAKGEGVKVEESQRTMVEILAQQDKRKLEVSRKLKEFQKGQIEMTQRMLELLAKGKELRIRDLKSMLKESDTQHKERQARQNERKVEVRKRKEKVRGLLVEFKKKRKEQVLSWRANFPKAIPPVNPQAESKG